MSPTFKNGLMKHGHITTKHRQKTPSVYEYLEKNPLVGPYAKSLTDLLKSVDDACEELKIEPAGDVFDGRYVVDALVRMIRILQIDLQEAQQSGGSLESLRVVNENLSNEVDELREKLKDSPEQRQCCGAFIRTLEQQILEMEQASTEQALELASFRAAADRDTQMQELKVEYDRMHQERDNLLGKVSKLRESNERMSGYLELLRRKLLGKQATPGSEVPASVYVEQTPLGQYRVDECGVTHVLSETCAICVAACVVQGMKP